MRPLPAQMMLAELRLSPQRWLSLGADDKDRLISVYLNGHRAVVPLSTRQVIAAGTDEYARAVSLRPAGAIGGNFSISGGASATTDNNGSSSNSTDTGNSSSSGGDQALKLFNTLLPLALNTALQVFNGLNATDQAKIRAAAEENVARISSTGARTQQDEQTLALSQALLGKDKGLGTGAIIALVAGGVLLVGGMVYLITRQPRRNPVIREGGRKKYISAAHARARRARKHRAA